MSVPRDVAHTSEAHASSEPKLAASGPFRLGPARFSGPLEAEFRAHYRRRFLGQMRSVWCAAALAWGACTVFDATFFPEHARALLVVRLVGFLVFGLAIVAVSLPR